MTDYQPPGYNTVNPTAVVKDPDSLLSFMTDVLGAEVLERYEQDGFVSHAEAQIGDSRVMVGGASDEYPLFPMMAHVYVADVDETYHKALAAGALAKREPSDQFYGDRVATIVDPHGNVWSLATSIEQLSPEELHKRKAGLG
jgi:PhnB protein